MQRILWGLCLAPMLSSCAQQTAKPGATTGSAVPGVARAATSEGSKVHLLPGGLTVQLLEKQKDETAQMLGVVAWKFRVVLPRLNQGLSCSIDLIEKGKAPRTLVTLGSSIGATQADITMGVDPIGIDTSRSDKLKLFVFARQAKNTSSTAQVVNNPFKARFTGWAPLARPESDGSFLLMQGSRAGYLSQVADTDFNLVCRFKIDKRYSAETLTK